MCALDTFVVLVGDVHYKS